MPRWLSFLWSEEWGGAGRGGGAGASWQKTGEDEWRAREGGERVSNLLLADAAGYALGPLRVVEVGARGHTEVSFHVRSLQPSGHRHSGEPGDEDRGGGADRDEGGVMDWLVVRAVGTHAVVPGNVSRVTAGQYFVSMALPRREAAAAARGGDGGGWGESGDVYVLQLAVAWRRLPVLLGSREAEEYEASDAGASTCVLADAAPLAWVRFVWR